VLSGKFKMKQQMLSDIGRIKVNFFSAQLLSLGFKNLSVRCFFHASKFKKIISTG
jgi:hypothetical protein